MWNVHEMTTVAKQDTKGKKEENNGARLIKSYSFTIRIRSYILLFITDYVLPILFAL